VSDYGLGVAVVFLAARLQRPRLFVKITTGGDDVGDRYREVVQSDEGFGFIQPDTGGKDVFVHISAVEKAGLSNLNEGAKVSHEVVANRGKESAENLRLG
jgi:CspA family cold shock protein